MRKRLVLLIIPFCLAGSAAAESTSGTDHGLYEQSIKSTKQSIDREMIEMLYHDAIEAYQSQRYDESLELLDKIYALDPHYEDVAKLRVSIRKREIDKETRATQGSVLSSMRKGDDASAAGLTVTAITYWKQALAINPSYAPARRKIDEANKALARKEFEAGTVHYRHGELEDALDSWSNAIALDPTYKQRGLLLLMSKIQLQVNKDQTSRLAAQGFDQYQQGNLEPALESYQQLSKLEPRNDEARLYTAKIKIRLGQAALKAAQDALAGRSYDEAIQQADKCLQVGYEIQSAQKVKDEAERQLKIARAPKPKPQPKPAVAVSTPTAAPAPPPATCENSEEALVHYRKGLSAMRTKDYHLAIQELDIAAQQCATNEHIYMARQRAQQEWSSANEGTPPPAGPGGAP